MTMRTAPCPRCQAVVVFGERFCRSCGQNFDYGPTPPPAPTPEQVVAVLQGLGLLPTAAPPVAPVVPVVAVTPVMPAGDVVTARPAPPRVVSVPEGAPVGGDPAGIDTGRFHVGDVVAEDVPGLIDSTLFAAYTPAHVDVEAVPGLETTSFDGVTGTAATLALPGLETSHIDVGDVVVDTVPGVYHSDMFAAGVDIAAGAAGAAAVLEVSPGALRPVRSPSSARRGPNDPLPRMACPGCGTLHAAPRCPSCASAHPDA
jgi:hypothetical protein